jgi:LacI family repressor for deo operon, udp, cdd, tsx, nupC, and nupG
VQTESREGQATIKDIAKATGFSIATVSNVMNHKGSNYGKATEELINKAIEELNYIPHAIARQLKNQSSRNIAFIVPNIDDYYSGLYSGIQSLANEIGYSLLLFNTNYDTSQVERFIMDIREQRFAGLIIATYFPDTQRIMKIKRGIPIVSIGKLDAHIPYVAINDKEVVKEAVNHLISLGHKRIGLFIGPMSVITEKDRFSGYLEAHQDNGLKVDAELIFQGNFVVLNSLSESYRIISEAIRRTPDISAFLFTSDYISVVALRVVADAGKRVPQDISIIGFDNLPITEYLIPRLTTISQDRFKVGYNGMKMLDELINGKSVENRIIEADLLIRDSTGRPENCGVDPRTVIEDEKTE